MPIYKTHMGKGKKEYQKDGSLLNAAHDNRSLSSSSSQPINWSVKFKKREFTEPRRSQEVKSHLHPMGQAYWRSRNMRLCQFLTNKTSFLPFQIRDLLFPTEHKVGTQLGVKGQQKVTKQNAVPRMPWDYWAQLGHSDISSGTFTALWIPWSTCLPLCPLVFYSREIWFHH